VLAGALEPDGRRAKRCHQLLLRSPSDAGTALLRRLHVSTGAPATPRVSSSGWHPRPWPRSPRLARRSPRSLSARRFASAFAAAIVSRSAVACASMGASRSRNAARSPTQSGWSRRREDVSAPSMSRIDSSDVSRPPVETLERAHVLEVLVRIRKDGIVALRGPTTCRARRRPRRRTRRRQAMRGRGGKVGNVEIRDHRTFTGGGPCPRAPSARAAARRHLGRRCFVRTSERSFHRHLTDCDGSAGSRRWCLGPSLRPDCLQDIDLQCTPASGRSPIGRDWPRSTRRRRLARLAITRTCRPGTVIRGCSEIGRRRDVRRTTDDPRGARHISEVSVE